MYVPGPDFELETITTDRGFYSTVQSGAIDPPKHKSKTIKLKKNFKQKIMPKSVKFSISMHFIAVLIRMLSLQFISKTSSNEVAKWPLVARINTQLDVLHVRGDKKFIVISYD